METNFPFFQKTNVEFLFISIRQQYCSSFSGEERQAIAVLLPDIVDGVPVAEQGGKEDAHQGQTDAYMEHVRVRHLENWFVLSLLKKTFSSLSVGMDEPNTTELQLLKSTRIEAT